MEQLRCYGCMQPRTEGKFCQHCGFAFDTPNAPHQLPVGTVLKGQYLVGKVLGQGGFGITYLGWDLYLSIPVAIKEYYPTGAVMRESTYGLAVTNCEGRTGSTFENNRRRFLREAQSLAQLTDVPEVVQVRNFFPENETAYIIMEYVRGETLKDHLQKQGLMTPSQVFGMMRPVLEGLKKVHAEGLVHRDISPDNIMLLPDGRVKLLDFGAVRDVEGTNAMRSTQAILKPGFAPIEQYKSRGDLGPWTDIYALCGTMYYCMTGKVPMDAPERVMDQCGIGWEQVPGLTAGQLHALNKGTELFPQNRLQSVQELLELLNAPSEEIPQSRMEPLPAAQESFSMTIPLVAEPAPEKPMAVTQPLQREEEIPGKYIAGIEDMKTMPLDRSGMAEPVSYTAPVMREVPPVAETPAYTVPVTPEVPAYVPEQPLVQPYNVPQKPASSKKNGLLPVIGIAAVILVLVIGFFTVHFWEDATCTSPKTCSLCGKTEGKALRHEWLAATCTEPRTCEACGETDGMASGHKWKAATCTSKKMCTVCNQVEGQALGHSWTAATYDDPKTCTRCNKTEGKPLGYRESVSGEWEKFHRNNSNTYALVFDTPLNKCRGFTLHFEPEFNSNTYVEEWKLYYRDDRGSWKAYGNFKIGSNGAHVTYTFNPKLNITAVAVIPVKNGGYSYSFSLWVTDAYVGS